MEKETVAADMKGGSIIYNETAMKGKIITLAEQLDELVKEGELCIPLENRRVRCVACGHRCIVLEGKRGICGVRYNRGGVLYVPWGYVGALQNDPIEKKPFYHFYPGESALTFGMLGCDFHCPYCQNWVISQAIRDAAAGVPPVQIEPEEIVMLAKKYRSSVIASSYNEPLITSEWAVGIFRLAKKEGFATAYISNGNATPEVLDYLRPWLDGYKVDLKSMRQKNYQMLGGVLQHTLDTIKMAYEKGFWVEVVTLIVPGFNDSEEELREAARYIRSVSPDIPWHVTAFHKNYRMTDPENTPAETLIRAAEIGYSEGLHYVYAGNLPGSVDRFEHTFCPGCGEALIQRYGFWVLKNSLISGTCPRCHHPIPGIWRKKATNRG
ncbi:MAG: AmmeMemoRadiSam system radical SAM enzyme [bacterium JZ-2024 1]